VLTFALARLSCYHLDRHRLLKCLYCNQKTRNTLDCDESNVYTLRVIFSSISPNLPVHSLFVS